MAERIPQSTTVRVPLQAYLNSSGHASPATGKTIAVTISKNGGAYGNPSAGATNATEVSDGLYYVNLSTTDTNTAGPLVVRGTEGTIDTIRNFYTIGAVAANVVAVNGVTITGDGAGTPWGP